MARRSSARPTPLAGTYRIDSGTCVLVADRDRPGAWLVEVNGVPSSLVDPDPTYLGFAYMRWFAALVHEAHSDEVARGPRVLHLGAGACTFPRYLAARYPAVRQVAVDRDERLTVLAREWFDLPRSPVLRVRAGDAREVTASLTPRSRDVVVRDVFAGSTTPRAATTVEFTRDVARVLGRGENDGAGLYVANCGATRDLRVARAEMATIASVFAHVAVVADGSVLKGRTAGNIVIAGSDRPVGADPAAMRPLASGADPARVLCDDEVIDFAGAAPVLRDGPHTDDTL